MPMAIQMENAGFTHTSRWLKSALASKLVRLIVYWKLGSIPAFLLVYQSRSKTYSA